MNKRIFYVTTAGVESGEYRFFSFFMKTPYHPSIKECVSYSEQKHPNTRHIFLVAISEIQPEDYDCFNPKTT
jgi:hypothetical protein